MKKAIILILVLLMASQIHAQVARWIIPPYYDSIYFATGADLIVTDSLNEKIVWTLDGNRLFKTSSTLYPFKEGITVITDKNSNRIKGFYTTEGKVTPLENCDVAHNYPYFSDGYMLVKKEKLYYFVNTEGVSNKRGVLLAYPFSNGYSSCIDYKNQDKQKETLRLLMNKDKDYLRFSYDDKVVSPDDIEFISSVNDENLGVVVVKHKVYYFEGEGKELRPVFAKPEESNLKKQAKLSGKLSECLTELDNSNMVLFANCGKSEQISIQFNAQMVPTEIRYNVDHHVFNTKPQPKRSLSSPITKSRVGNLIALFVDGTLILPAQFESVNACFGDDAFVKLSGKHGMLRVSKDEHFELTINKGKDIAFRHQTFETTIRLDMPASIPAGNTYIEPAPSELICSIDPKSIEFKNTSNGNYVQYDCTLGIPSSLPDEITELSYPMQIVSDGLRFAETEMKVNAWHYKYLNVDIIDSETTVSKGTVSFSFNINAERLPNEDFYPISVNILLDSVYPDPELQKISETRYKCTVRDLIPGENNITIEIMEQGCPPTLTPYKFNYTKPSAKNKHKEQIDIKKKKEEKTEDGPIFDL